MEINKAGTLNVSKKISAAFSRFLLGFKGASVNRTGCCNKKKKKRSKISGKEILKYKLL